MSLDNCWKRFGLAVSLPLFASWLAAQQPGVPAKPRFDVVSIRPFPPNAPPVFREQTFTPILPGGQYVDPAAMLFSMIAFAYNVEDPSIRLVGLPSSMNKAYSVSAKPGPGFPLLSPAENREQVRLMLRAMLEDRFRLQLHTEMRKGQVYSLQLDKGGLKFKEVDPPVPPQTEGFVNAAMGDDGGRIIGKKSTMAGMAKMLVIFLKRPVVDRTGLKGYYDFDVKWDEPELAGGRRASPSFGADGSALLVSVLRNHFGLRLTSGAGQVKYWVVDHVQGPGEN